MIHTHLVSTVGNVTSYFFEDEQLMNEMHHHTFLLDQEYDYAQNHMDILRAVRIGNWHPGLLDLTIDLNGLRDFDVETISDPGFKFA